LGFLGASTGAAAGLVAAARRQDVRAIVSRGGRPDFAGDALEDVTALTLLAVGVHDPEEPARAAYPHLHCERVLELGPAATHLFEEPGTPGAGVALGRAWFLHHLDPSAAEACHAAS
jgi:putative phosphoribosyl transferase